MVQAVATAKGTLSHGFSPLATEDIMRLVDIIISVLEKKILPVSKRCPKKTVCCDVLWKAAAGSPDHTVAD